MCQNVSKCHHREIDHIIHFKSSGSGWEEAQLYLYLAKLACKHESLGSSKEVSNVYRLGPVAFQDLKSDVMQRVHGPCSLYPTFV
jgi:hypothetical protein